ncbi:type I-G CRISPR-associated protein Csb2 [Saccharopolyspora sp. NPDC002376]
MLTYAFPRGIRISGKMAGAVTGCLRKTVMSRVPDPIPPEINGHGADNQPHLAYLPLLDSGHPDADGDVIGVGVLVPDGRTDLVAAVDIALAESFELRLPGAHLRLRRRATAGTPLEPEWWSRRSRRWATVTPMVLDRFSGRDNEEAEVSRACQRVGLPEPTVVTTGRDPLVRGGAFLGRGDLARQEKAPRPFLHVLLEFPTPVSGPVLLGAQRYLGMGLCVPR